MQKIIYTIGHSTRNLDEFMSILETFSIELLVDVRSFPGSRKYPHFNKESLAKEIPAQNMLYLHLPALGGRRKTSPQSKNTAWKNESFRGYADYMETGEFKKGMEELEKAGSQYKTAFMCSEAVWWRCHRSMIADYLKAKGWQVLHILNNKKVEEHPYTAVAKIVDGNLRYSEAQQNLF